IVPKYIPIDTATLIDLFQWLCTTISLRLHSFVVAAHAAQEDKNRKLLIYPGDWIFFENLAAFILIFSIDVNINLSGISRHNERVQPKANGSFGIYRMIH